MEALSDLFLDALLDSLRMLPFLFGAYLLMEWMEHRSGQGMEAALAGARRLGPVTGALLGCVPQCGFSVVAANLYAGGIISAGTLVAVFLSTSDEAVPLLLGAPEGLATLLPLLGLKVAAGILVGTAVDWTAALLARRRPPVEEELHRICRRCGCEEGGILSAALRHTGSVFLFILLVNLALGWGVAMLGEDRLAALLLADHPLQPFAAALVGLIPNCAVSVLLTRLYLGGAVSFASLAAGLLPASGAGLLVLLRMNPRPRENLALLAGIWAAGAGVGMALQVLG